MSEFSLQHPLVRDFQLEPIFLKITKDMEYLTETDLVNLYINGENRGIFQLKKLVPENT